MDLFSFLSYAIMGCALIVIFRNSEDRASQFMGIFCIALSTLLLMVRADVIPFFSGWRIEIVFPAGIGVVGLIVMVRIEERSFALLMIALAALQILIATNYIQKLS